MRMLRHTSDSVCAMESHHALVIPCPVQGHVIPLMELSHCLIDRGFRITFVNTQFNHARVMAALSNTGGIHSKMRMAAIPDGMEAGDDRKNVLELTNCFLRAMPGGLEKLISEINESGGDKITCVIADWTIARALEVAVKMGIRTAAVWPASVEFWRLLLKIPKLIEDGVIDANGFPTKEHMIKHSPAFPAMPAAELPWLAVADRVSHSQQTDFRMAPECGPALEFADWLLCNSCREIEPTACELSPNIRTIGPLLAGSRLGRLEGNFWREDPTCLQWLDEQPPNSVVYVAFGSFTVFDRRQFQELALGLELCSRSFLWVVRPDLTDASTDAFPDGFKTRVGDRGQVVGWSPQQKVLAHPSIACFITHCGWNSTTEGLNNGVPFLCWPYFADQKLNRTYICEIWKVGIALEKDGDGIVSREEIKEKIEALISDVGIKARSLEFKGIVRKSIAEGGSSSKNFDDFVEAIKTEKNESF